VTNIAKKHEPIRLAMIGGGPGAFIGPVHRIAAQLDGEFKLVAGTFSSDPQRSLQAGLSYGIEPDRAYRDVDSLIACERARPDGAELIAIVTPNHLHFSAARAALDAGFSVMSDKPATATLAQALELRDIVARASGLYGLTYTYTGYPLVREARARIAAGEIGALRKVVVEYFQGWLAGAPEQAGNKQAAWRVDPARAGMGGCIGDIGVHAFNLAEFITGHQIIEVNPQLDAMVEGRSIDDDCTILTRYDNGATGYIAASQVATGERNGLTIRIYGERGSIAWHQERSDRLVLTAENGTQTILWGGTDALGPSAGEASRLPSGHPEGYFEAFANLYRDMARKLRGGDAPLLPTIQEGVRSMAFVATSVERNGGGWTSLHI